MKEKHVKWAVLGHTGSGKSRLMEDLRSLKGPLPGAFSFLQGKRILSLSQEDQSRFLDMERKRDESDILEYQDKGTTLRNFISLQSEELPEEYEKIFRLNSLLEQGLSFLSTGERKKSFILKYLLEQPEVLILENPLEGLDKSISSELLELLNRLPLSLILIVSRPEDIPSDFTSWFYLNQGELTGPDTPQSILELFNETAKISLQGSLPPPLKRDAFQGLPRELFSLKNIELSYYGKKVLNGINWRVQQGEFWQLTGVNGSGKSTLLSLINGDNPRAYGQDITLFGKAKGSGESIWDIRSKIGMFSPALQQDFRIRTTVEEVILSGFEDSIGIYKKISGYERLLMDQWMQLVPFSIKKDWPFSRLSSGQQRLLLLIRSLVKHPPLLLLDEPLLGMDADISAYMADLINLAAKESESTLIYVSHRSEERLKASHILELIPQEDGSSMGFIRELQGV